MKQLLQNLRDGVTETIEVPIPTPKAGTALVRTAASLVSAGTERMLVEFAEKSLIGKARSRPDLVRQVVDKARREGLLSTAEAAFNRLDQPMPLGYSSAGTIIELGEGVKNYKVGQRVVCAGSGAVHAEYAVVSQNLLAPLPDDVPFEEGAFSTLGAIAMHGFRLAKPQIGERAVVIGMGLLGLLTASIARAAGCKVLGIDLDPNRIELTKSMGFEATLREGAEESAIAFSQGQGADMVLICADTPSNDPVTLAGEIARDRGQVVSLGVVGMELPRRSYFAKELNFIVSRSYGPGRYDKNYEEKGIDYPIGYVRWTEGRNLAAFAELLNGKQIDIFPIISHRFNIEDAGQAYDLITGKSEEPFLGVILTYPQEDSADMQAGKKITLREKHPAANRVTLGVLGAGLYAGAVLLPTIKKIKGIELVGIVSAGGLSAQHAAKKFGFGFAASDEQTILDDPNINTLAILTRHYLHTPQALAGLRAGKHVFVEKPLAINQEQLDEIEAELTKPDAPLLMVGFNRRFAPLAVQMKTFIDQRQEPLTAHYRVNAGLLPKDHWHYDIEQGGGRIISEGCHFIDFITWLVGAPPISVTAQGLPDGGRYYEENVVMTFEFSDGSVGTISYLANGDKSYSKERVEVFAGGRIAVLDDYRSLETIYKGRRKVTRSRLRQDKGHKAEWKAFVQAILTSEEPPISYTDLIGGSRASFGAVESLRSSLKILLSP